MGAAISCRAGGCTARAARTSPAGGHARRPRSPTRLGATASETEPGRARPGHGQATSLAPAIPRPAGAALPCPTRSSARQTLDALVRLVGSNPYVGPRSRDSARISGLWPCCASWPGAVPKHRSQGVLLWRQVRLCVVSSVWPVDLQRGRGDAGDHGRCGARRCLSSRSAWTAWTQ